MFQTKTMNKSDVTAFGGALYKGQSNNISNELEDFLLAVMGPQQMDDKFLLILITIFYLLLFITGLMGNLSVCIVIFRSKNLHTAMNYYLVSLAIADITIIIMGESYDIFLNLF